jgi:uncharacterized protein
MSNPLGVTALVVALLVAGVGAARAVEVHGLYRGEAIVTGTEEPERTRGFRLALRDVFVKLTGDVRLARDDRLASLLVRPHRFVEAFEYEDRMKDIPVHDEQGTRERPHFLRVTFKKPLIDAAVARLGLKTWPSDRPLVAVWLGVVTARGQFVLRRVGEDGYGQRAVLVETAEHLGLPIKLPDAGNQAVHFEDVAKRRLGVLQSASAPADGMLLGVLAVTPDGYWDIDWQLSFAGRVRRWAQRKISFDKALRGGLQSTVGVLSRYRHGR